MTKLKFSSEINSPKAPLFVLVHGRGGNFNVMSAFKRCFPAAVNFYFPQAPDLDPDISGFSWWNINDRENLIEKANISAELLKTNLDMFINEHQLQPEYIAACGFSQGAALLGIILQKYPKLFKSLALLSGFVIEYPDLARKSEGTEVFMFHGTLDEIIPFKKTERAVSYLSSLNYKIEFFQEAVAHKLGTAGMRALKDFFNRL